MTTITRIEKNPVARQLRPVVMIFAAANVLVAGLLLATASWASVAPGVAALLDAGQIG